MGPQNSDRDSARPQPSAAGPGLSQDEVEKRISHLRWCHQTGLVFQEIGRGIGSRRKIAEAAQRMDIPVREVPRYKQFSREYTLCELEDQFTEFRRAGFAFFPSHYRVLMAIGNKAARAKLASRGVQERLGVAELRDLKQQITGNPNVNGGRRPAMLNLEGAELAEAVDRKKEKFRKEIGQILNRPGGVEPDLQKRIMQLLRRLR